MSIPSQHSILQAIEEFKRVKEGEFLKRHSSGARPRKVYLNYGGERFPLKAIWAAAHQPPVHTRIFTTNVAKAGFRKLGFRDFWPPENSN
ncbi:hypothetical protein [Bradyrhizobium sp. NAS96.2]|uniref:hypothetical protein n=1 Tax=Bradyrhizobium sp. NAS96.2 TaxID=1680160 RepID=UPI00093D37B7|nr:hypothetical protein [Bradyrhizobium sp. NAS96.2]